MADMKDIVKVAVDAYHGNVEQYSVGQSQELLHKALVDANGGSTVLNYKNIRDGKCNGLFTLIEEILSRTVVEGLQGDEYFNALVDFRNVAEGDKNIFEVEDSNLFIVSEAADGTQSIRRQRLSGTSEVSIPTSLKVVKIYEELNRVLAGRVDFNTFINKVSESFRKKLLNDVYTLWSSASASDFGGTTYFPTAGAYDEDELLELISHVEAAAGGKPATIICTKKAARKLGPSVQGTDSQSDLYNMGYYGKFYGTPVVVTPQRHKVGSTEFVMRDDVLTILAGDDKPMPNMFFKCHNIKNIPELDTSQVTNMSSMFGYCYSLESIPAMDTSQVTNMQTMFEYCYALSAIPTLSTPQVTNMNGMFNYCNSFEKITLNPNLAGWSGANITLSSCHLSHAALVDLFNSLPTITTSKKLTLSSSRGFWELTDAEKAIATGKNWTLAT